MTQPTIARRDSVAVWSVTVPAFLGATALMMYGFGSALDLTFWLLLAAGGWLWWRTLRRCRVAKTGENVGGAGLG
jgi:uncharacterized protein (DUF58 family)